MTHSLHRCGSEDSLRNDYVFLCTPAKGVNNSEAAGKLARILDILLEFEPVNIGFYGHGSLIDDICIEDIKKRFHDNSRLRCCFDEKEKVKELLRILTQEDLGLSITLSGLVSELTDIGAELNLTPHTINIACGVFGRVDRLPESKSMEISTLCGHGMVAHGLVKAVIKGLQREEIDIKEAVHRLTKPCTCGIFNPSRAYDILQGVENKNSPK